LRGEILGINYSNESLVTTCSGSKVSPSATVVLIAVPTASIVSNTPTFPHQLSTSTSGIATTMHDILKEMNGIQLSAVGFKLSLDALLVWRFLCLSRAN
jgi:hypothetical protein